MTDPLHTWYDGKTTWLTFNDIFFRWPWLKVKGQISRSNRKSTKPGFIDSIAFPNKAASNHVIEHTYQLKKKKTIMESWRQYYRYLCWLYVYNVYKFNQSIGFNEIFLKMYIPLLLFCGLFLVVGLFVRECVYLSKY